MWDSNHNPADYDENLGRGNFVLLSSLESTYFHFFTLYFIAIACEVLARRVIHRAAPEKIHTMMSTRFVHREVDGDESDRLSAIELAIDSHW